MKRLLATVVLLLMGSLSTATANQSTDCGDVATYLETVDAAMVEEMYAVVSAPGWAQDAIEAQEALDATDGTYEGITREDIAPLLDYLGVAGEVLNSIDESGVPESTRELHESAAGYWSVSMEMIETAVTGGTLTSTPSVGQFETLIARNIAAQDELRSACADVLQPYEEREAALGELFKVLDSGEGTAAFENVSPDDLAGIGYFFLFFGEVPVEASSVSIDSTPAMVEEIPATPED